MKARFVRFVLVCSLLTSALFSQEEATVPPPIVPIRPAQQLEELFGPIALYPDALIALILPASTFSSDIVLAARFLDVQGERGKTDNEPWDDSVKALAHYPEVIRWMDQNLAWTRQAGDAFVAQPAEVMNAIQRLRARARAAGTLVDTPQQQVVVEEGNIRIIPAQPDVIYVPRYDPEVVYVSRPVYYSDPFLTFGVGFATGYWLGYDFDWGRRRIWCVDYRDRERFWHEHRDWRYPQHSRGPDHLAGSYRHRTWEPRPDYYRSYRSPNSDYRRTRPEAPRPVVTPRQAIARVPEPRSRVNDYPHDRNARGTRDRGDRAQDSSPDLPPRPSREDRPPRSMPGSNNQPTSSLAPTVSPSPQPARIQAPARQNFERRQRPETDRAAPSNEARSLPTNTSPREARLSPAPQPPPAPRFQSAPPSRAEPSVAPQRDSDNSSRSENRSSGRVERPDRIRASQRE